MESSCGERDLIGRFHVEVQNGLVHAVEGLDKAARRYIDSRSSEGRMVGGIPTLAGLLAEADAAHLDGAEVVNVTTDPEDGHPESIEIDWVVAAIDDEACYTIADFDPPG